MKATIKEAVKNIFKANTFEAALDLTRNLRGEYIAEYGVNSWNALVSYYKKANIQPEVPMAAEPVTSYEDTPVEESKGNDEEERVEYMLYQNDGDKVDWYGHFVNYKGLKVGEKAMMVRMNNLGIGMGKVLATASMTMNEIGMFHKCYAAIRQNTASDNKRVELFTKAFNNLQIAMQDAKFSTLSTGRAIADFVLNYKKED